MRRRVSGAEVIGAVVGLTLAAGWPAAAQFQELGPPPRPIAILLADRPVVTVTFNGDYGPVRVTGTLEEAPREPLELADAAGKEREAAWVEIESIALVRSAAEGLPLGSFTARLVSEAGGLSTAPTGFAGYLSPALATPGFGQRNWKLARMPEGRLVVRGDAFGRLAIETTRVVYFAQEPVRGAVRELPAGEIRLEVVRGTTVSVPLAEVETLRRDLPAGTVAVTLADGQMFTGKLIELPKVALTVQQGTTQQTIPLERVAQLEVRLPSGGGALGTTGR